VGLSTAFGCTIQGRVDPAEVLRLVRALVDLGVERIGLADTVGYADPAQVAALFTQAFELAGDRLACGHFHDTRGLGLANVYAAWSVGVRRFDACVGGIGGCPHAPGASGNVAPRTWPGSSPAWAAHRAGLRAADGAARPARGWLDGEPLHGSIWRAGLPKTTAHAWLTRRVPETRRHERASLPRPHPPAGRPEGAGVHPHGDGPDLRHGAGRHGRRGDQGRADRRRSNTRRLLGAGAGFFPMFNRNKKSVEINLQHPDGAEVARRLCASADVVAENFKPGTMAKYGLDYPSLSAANPRLIYASLKGFLPGPYEHRTALDEVVQMMGGLAYMTGRPGDPLRAGTSVNDIMGGMFGAIGTWPRWCSAASPAGAGGAVGAVREQRVPGRPAHAAVRRHRCGRRNPCRHRISAWACLRRVHRGKEGEQIFLAAVSDAQWQTFCEVLDLPDLGRPGATTNNQRVPSAPRLLPVLRERFAPRRAADLAALFELAGLPYAPIRKPEDLFDDPHLQATGGLAET
jgi:crotonobetainyl-CoA:carnitine CoA-transferase CaiB-like acyl-CoA transferase